MTATTGTADYESLVKSVAERRSELFRMRAIATSLLAAMTVLFLATRHAPSGWAAIPYLHAFAEAGMVGACADWFAVVAIFRRPLGLPIPHTAVVPENKKRLGAALGRFVAANFLAPRAALARLRRVDALRMTLAWLENPRSARALADGLAGALPVALSSLAPETRARWAAVVARKGLETIPLAPLASRALAVLWAQGAGQLALDQAVDFLETTLERNQGVIAKKVREQSSKWVPKFVDDMVAAKLMTGFTQMLKEMRTPGHPWRDEVGTRVEKLIADLAHDPEMRARGEALKQDIAESAVFARQTEALWGELELALQTDLKTRSDSLAAAIVGAASALSRWVDEDEGRAARLNRKLRLWLLRAVLPRRAEIGAYIAEVVDRWDARTLVERLELQVGKDLQYIRINGTLVGGLAGLAIYILNERLF